MLSSIQPCFPGVVSTARSSLQGFYGRCSLTQAEQLAGLEDQELRQEDGMRQLHVEEVPPCLLTCFGQAQIVSVVPYCAYKDILVWASTCSQLRTMLEVDSVWRQLISDHFHPALECVLETSPEHDVTEEAAGRLLNQLSESSSMDLYRKLSRISTKPFVLPPRSRLVLEIHELREWDQHQKAFRLQRQAKVFADALGHEETSALLCRNMSANALELLSLMTMLGDGKAPKVSELPEVKLGPSTDQEIQEILQRRIQQRRQWWQRQREFLLQDLNWH